MNLIFNTNIDFILRNKHIIAEDNSNFLVNKQGEDLIITSENNTSTMYFKNNSITKIFKSNNSSINVNGISIDINGDSVSLNGNIKEIIVNNKKIPIIEEETKKTEKSKDSFNIYKLEELIESITIKGSSNIKIEESEMISKEKLNLFIFGSGNLSCDCKLLKEKFINDNLNINFVNMRIQGSGDIKLERLFSNYTDAFIMGSGDISFKDCSFNDLNLSIMGSGDIKSKDSTVKKLNKSIMGSGEIKGFK